MENMHYAAHMCEPTFRAGNEPVSIISFSKLRCLNSCVLTVTFQLVAHGPAKTARMTSGYLDRREAATSTVLAITRKTLRTVTQAAGPARLPLSCKANVSIDAIIAIAFGLAATITSLIAIYIMWQDRSARGAALQSSDPTTSNETRLAGRSRTHDTLRRPNSCKTVSDEPSRIPPSGGRFLPCDVKDVESADSMRLKGIHLARTGPQLELMMNHEQAPLGLAHTALIGELCEDDCKWDDPWIQHQQKNTQTT
ncbi:hypothetical protein BGZ57DRAFT_923019 [Hyaloscypha finlandica]|nr:hypothetical protein F5882DRAFT_460988 [Hyaloscypha sp. PMI_1271]KAH8791193.1 hypothetical protein BGZ57DRAFT_923019 [Hyaloscypha finlandica]